MPTSVTTVNLYRGGVYPVVHAVQNDTGRILKMVVMDETIASGSTGQLYFVRQDKSMYNVACTLVLADNAFTANLTQALTRPGKTFAQLKITSSGAVVSSHTFVIEVEKSTDGVPTEQLGVTIEDLLGMVDDMEGMLDDVEEIIDHITTESFLDPSSESLIENGVVTKAVQNVSVDLVNLIPLTIFEAGHITSGGADDTLAGCFRSTYMPVTPGDTLRIDPNGKYLTVVEYKKDRSFVKLNGYYGSNNSIVTLSGDTYFIRFVIRSNPIDSTDTVSIVDNCCVKRIEFSHNNDSVLTSDSANLVMLTRFEAGSVDTSDGSDYVNAGYFRSAFIPVQAGDRLRIDPNGKYLTVLEYSYSGSYITYHGFYSANNTSLTLSGTTRYIRFVIRSNPANAGDSASIVNVCVVKRFEFDSNYDTVLDTNSLNLIELTRFEPGSLNGSTGAAYDNDGHYRSAYVPVNPGDKLRLDPNGKYLTVVEFDKSGSFIKLNGFYSADDTGLTLSGTTHYIRFVIRSNPVNTSDTVSIVNSCRVERLDFDDNGRMALANNDIDLINYTRFESGSLAGSTGRAYANDGCFRSAFIPVVPYDILDINPNGKYLTVVEFDEDGTFVKLNGYYTVNKTTLTLDAATHYIKFVIHSNPQNASDPVSIVNTCVVKKHNFSRNDNIGMQMFSRIGVIGDSVSVGWTKDAQGNRYRRNLRISWPQQMCRRLGSIGYNLGASGVDPIEWFDSTFEYYEWCYPNYLATEECELYIIGLGLNGGTIGSTSDINQNDYTLNAQTFFGQYARMIQMINHDHPKSKVICITEPSTKATSYDQAIRDICALNFIDAELVDLDNDYYWLFNHSKITAEGQGDNLHYTPYGYSLIADAMIHALNDYISKNPTHFKYVGAGVDETEADPIEAISSQEIEEILGSLEE